MLKDFNLKADRQENVTDLFHSQLVHKLNYMDFEQFQVK